MQNLDLIDLYSHASLNLVDQHVLAKCHGGLKKWQDKSTISLLMSAAAVRYTHLARIDRQHVRVLQESRRHANWKIMRKPP